MQFTLVFRRYAPFAEFGFGFEGDNRTQASTSPSATARTIGSVDFGPEMVGSISATSSGTKHKSKLINDLSTKLGRTHSKVDASVKVQTRTLKIVQFYASTSGANPFLQPVSPAIDTFVKITAVFAPAALNIEGKVMGDDFPNAEVIVYDEDGGGVILCDFRTTRDKDTGPGALFGSGEGTVLDSFAVRLPISAEGLFQRA